jgi:hypothetical protein
MDAGGDVAAASVQFNQDVALPASADGVAAAGDSTGMDAGLRVDPAPFALSEHTPLTRVHFLFAICLFAEVLVVSNAGWLVGVIVKSDLTDPRRLSRDRLTAGARHDDLGMQMAPPAGAEDEQEGGGVGEDLDGGVELGPGGQRAARGAVAVV